MSAHILFMEDEQQIREVVTEYLKIAQYQVTAVEDGDTALAMLQDATFDLVILDIMVPGPSGIEVLASIRERGLTVPVIMLSALNGEETQLEAFNHYADDYVTKPFSPLILLKRVETLLRRIAPSHPQQARFYCDEDAYQAFYEGQSLELTLSEFQFLHALMTSPTRVFTRENLIEAIYQGDYFGSDRVIDSHMKNLRKKLPLPLVRTVIGVGYQFDEAVLQEDRARPQ